MGTGASKKHSVEKPNETDNVARSTVVENCSASTLPDTTSIRPQVEHLKLEDDEVLEDIEQMAQPIQIQNHAEENEHTINGGLETEDVSLTFESFQHKNGTLYTCFTQNGIRMYFDDEQGIVPFPEELYSQGKFIHTLHESKGINDDVKEESNGSPSHLGNDRTSSFHIPGKGMVMTYMFEERVNVCKYYDSDSGAWLILPLLWEMNLDFIHHRVQQVKEIFPAITDYKEILAALRLCNYDPDEVISVFFAMFGDSLENAINGQQNFQPVTLQRDLAQKEKKIQHLTKCLQEKESELENLQSRCRHLEEEKRLLIQQSHGLHKKVAELQVEHEKYLKEITLIKSQKTEITNSMNNCVPIRKELMLRMLGEARELYEANYQLRAVSTSGLSEIGVCIERLQKTVVNMHSSSKEIEEIRALYQREAIERKLLYNQLQELRGNIRVFCRCRPDDGKGTHLEFPSEEEIIVNQNSNRKHYRYDQVFLPQCTQEEVFEGTLPIIKSCVDGYNVCIIAYGQTGSGKTYTMMGNDKKPGVNIRSIRELLHICQQREKIKYITKIAMLEIYNENVWDLLSQSGNKQLEIRAQGKTVTLPGLMEIEVLTEEDIKNTISIGEKNRTVASTKMNTESSRSHLMVILKLNGVDSVTGVATSSSLTLCDLAGSERISKTEATGQRLVEAAAINKSLTSLGQGMSLSRIKAMLRIPHEEMDYPKPVCNVRFLLLTVFNALKTNSLHVPYRNSKLTHLLQPSLSGQAKACVFVNISPDLNDLAETISTLQFGSSIQQIALGKPIPHISNVKSGQ